LCSMASCLGWHAGLQIRILILLKNPVAFVINHERRQREH